MCSICWLLGQVNYSTYLLVDSQPNSKNPSRANLNLAVSLLTATAVIFRAEVALLLVPLCLQYLITKRTTFSDTMKVGFASGLFYVGKTYFFCLQPFFWSGTLALTVIVDSYFWNQFLNFRASISTLFKARAPSGAWAALLFSVMLVAESRLQTSPPQTYITSYLPKLLLSALPLSMIGCLSDKRIRTRLWAL